MCTRVFVHIHTHIYIYVDVTSSIEAKIIIFCGIPYSKHVYGYFVIFNDFLIDDQ